MKAAIGTRVAVASLVAILAFAAITTNTAKKVSAGLGPLPVSGIIYDSAGEPLVGADVAVTVYNKTTHLQVGPTLTIKSDEVGFYTVTIDPGNYQLGDKVDVVASYNSQQANNSTAAQEPMLWIDVHFALAIHQFGNWLGFAVAAALIATVAVVFLKKRR